MWLIDHLWIKAGYHFIELISDDQVLRDRLLRVAAPCTVRVVSGCSSRIKVCLHGSPFWGRKYLLFRFVTCGVQLCAGFVHHWLWGVHTGRWPLFLISRLYQQTNVRLSLNVLYDA